MKNKRFFLCEGDHSSDRLQSYFLWRIHWGRGWKEKVWYRCWRLTDSGHADYPERIIKIAYDCPW